MVDKTRVTAAEFFQLPETNQPTELLDGEIIVSPAPTPKHQRCSRRFERIVEDTPNGEMFHAPIDLYLEDENVVQPDIVWVAANSRCVITSRRLEGPPELIVEFFSPGTVKQDKTTKFKLYERHGVREYWMVDPIEQYVEVWVLVDSRYLQQGVYGEGDTFESPVLGKSVELKGVFDV